jgi:ketol-acid reductoisomerase
MTAWEILEAAGSHMRDRAATYDSPAGERSMGSTVAMFNTLVGQDMTEEQGWLFMALLKMVRSQQGELRMDSYEDGAAYFALAGEAAKASRGEAPQASGAIGPSILPDEEV